MLRDLLSFGGPLRDAPERRNRGGEASYRKASQLGWEGLIAERADSQYRAGRQRDWLKFKCLNGQEFVIGGYTTRSSPVLSSARCCSAIIAPDRR